MSLLRIFFLLMLCLISWTGLCFPDPQVELRPSITLSTTYDDNIFLNDNYKRSDLITTLSPGLSMQIVSDNRQLQVSYAPSFRKFQKYSEYDNIGHNAQLNFQEKLTRRLHLNFEDSYLKTDDPLDADFFEDVIGQETRQSRNTYQRNSAQLFLDYQFGSKDNWVLGYKHNLLENEEPTEDDAVSHGPYTQISYWFDVANGLDWDYEYQVYNYNNDAQQPAQDDFYSHRSNITYTHRYSPHTSLNTKYGITTRNHDQDSSADYHVHDTSIGISHAFSPHLSISAGTGYYRKVSQGEDDEQGVSFDLGLNKEIEHGRFALQAESGWDQGLMEAEERDFTRYWSISSSFDYEISQHLNSYASVAYRENNEDQGADEDITTGKLGIKRQFKRWYFWDLNYAYNRRQSQDPTDEYTDNRITFQIGYNQPFRW